MQTGVILLGGLALFGGFLVAAQGPIYARLSEGLGRDHMTAVFLAFLTATIALGILVLATGRHRTLVPGDLIRLPYWVWLGGLFGAIHVAISMQTIPVLGVSAFIVIVVAGNLIGAAVYDQLGAFGLLQRPISLERLLGLALVLAGVALSVRN